MSALPPKADIGTQSRDVRFVPIATKVSQKNNVYSITPLAAEAAVARAHKRKSIGFDIWNDMCQDPP